MTKRCLHCGRESLLVSSFLGLCAACLRRDFRHLLPHLQQVHREARLPFGLPPGPPQEGNEVSCQLCVNECRIPPGGRGYCGLRTNDGGRLTGAGADRANVSWYYDPLPTNCVAAWVCPAGTGAGYPQLAYRPGPEYGYNNLAVFYQACSFDCLFCQNWHYRSQSTRGANIAAPELAGQINQRTACVCYFGGDPTPQLPHALRASRLMLERREVNILRICWESNGSMHPGLLGKMAELSLRSGGCVKIDFKAWDEGLHIALCGVSNRRTLHNFRLLAEYARSRPEPPFLIASTLLVPGYVDSQEIFQIARFIASLDANIPYTLLAFAPQFHMGDLPTTSASHAQQCLEAAQAAGLKRVRVGNEHLLSHAY